MKTILHLIEKAGGYRREFYLRIENPPYMALVIEATPEPGPLGSPGISVAHYGEQNGDLMRDPEMCFELGQLHGSITLDPYCWRNDYAGVEQWSRSLVDGRYSVMTELHQLHLLFAAAWDRKLSAQ